jgi:dihydropyrimidinase
MSLLIKNGRIITADQDYTSDIYIQNEKIHSIGPSLTIDADKVIDAKGKYVIPGGIDVHTHLDMPLGNIVTADDFETGTKAAAFGGTTCIIDYATQARGTNIQSALDLWMKKAEGKACIDYAFHMIITELPSKDYSELDKLVDKGITSFKLFMAYPNALQVDDETIFKIIKYSKQIGALVCLHAEDGEEIEKNIRKCLMEEKDYPINHALTRSSSTEAEAVRRAITISEKANAPVYFVHVSTADALNEISKARNKKLPVYAETCPQYLFLSLDDMNKPGFEDAKLVFTPPPREKWNQEKLWEGLRNNSLQIVSTDHCSFNFKGQKDLGKNDFTKIPNGGPGIETRLQLTFSSGVLHNKISLKRWIEINSTTPAKMFGMFPRKGTIAEGSDADIVIWNPAKENFLSASTHHMAVDYSLYEGKKVSGNADVVISCGEIIIEDNIFYGKPGRGKYIKRDKFNFTT